MKKRTQSAARVVELAANAIVILIPFDGRSIAPVSLLKTVNCREGLSISGTAAIP
jgi:hypothetical protein